MRVNAERRVELVRALTTVGAGVRVVMTASAQHFVTPLTFATLSRQAVLTDPVTLDDEATMPHIAASHEADLLLVAPATAHTIAKFAQGLADDLLSTLFLKEIGAQKGARIVVGFAAETGEVVRRARHKLTAKQLDLIVANDVSQAGAGFACETNLVVLLDPEGGVEELPLLPKRQVARRILDRVVGLRQQKIGSRIKAKNRPQGALPPTL